MSNRVSEAVSTVLAVREYRDAPISDVSRAIQSMILVAWGDGVGRKKVGLPDKCEVLAVVPFGYPKQAIGQGKRKGKRKRKPPADVASAERCGTPFEVKG
ncbi:MAG: hypothetical protein ACYDAL_09955 [Candidatus Dormibacteraceae bacterium]